MNTRAELKRFMLATLADQNAHHNWFYTQARPRFIPDYAPGHRVFGDCSKGVQFLCKWAKAPDPMGNDFGPYGNSQTICFHLRHLASPSSLMVGDIVTYGWNGSDHAAMVLETGIDPLMWSFGHQGAPDTNRLSSDRRPKQYLRLPVAPHIITKEEKLRERTGWFAWEAWRLGEGDWKRYGPKNPKVRPSVPKVIPASWWVRNAQFLANRKKGG